MKVKAIQNGYYDNKRQKAGATFHLHLKEDFSSTWMEEAKVKAKTESKPKKPFEAKADLNAEII
jgi:hypothetical protein